MIKWLLDLFKPRPNPGPPGLWFYDSKGRGYSEDQVHEIFVELERRKDQP